MFENRTLTCRECGEAFIFTGEEQEFYVKRGFDNPPRRCAQCRASARAMAAAVKPKRITYAAVCSACGQETQLPFKPTGEKPVYCADCFARKKAETT